jgi:hypothetical protein
VLTDAEFFGGSVEDLRAAREASACPCCARTSPCSEADVVDARLMGADAVLLIAAALSDDELARFLARADAPSAWPPWSRCTTRRSSTAPWRRGAPGRGQPAGPAHLQVDHDRACALAARIPADVVAVAESGIRDGDDARRLADAGYDAILVGRPWCGRPTAPPRCGRSSATRSAATMTDGPLRQDLRHHVGGRRAALRQLGADAVGFIFAPSPRQVSVQLAGDIAKRLPPEILTVGVFRDEAPQRVVEKVQSGRPGRGAQLHGHESAQETKPGSGPACPS